MKVCGIDSGLGGAIAFLAGDDCQIFDMPVLQLARAGKNKREIDPHALAALLWRHHADHVFVEAAGAMPARGQPDSTGRRRAQGASSAFAFGKSYGIVIGVLAAIGLPMTVVAPRAWKTALGVPAAKDGARARAGQLLPGGADQWPRVKDHGRAEAALIALFGSRSLVVERRDAA